MADDKKEPKLSINGELLKEGYLPIRVISSLSIDDFVFGLNKEMGNVLNGKIIDVALIPAYIAFAGTGAVPVFSIDRENKPVEAQDPNAQVIYAKFREGYSPTPFETIKRKPINFYLEGFETSQVYLDDKELTNAPGFIDDKIWHNELIEKGYQVANASSTKLLGMDAAAFLTNLGHKRNFTDVVFLHGLTAVRNSKDYDTFAKVLDDVQIIYVHPTEELKEQLQSIQMTEKTFSYKDDNDKTIVVSLPIHDRIK